ncbi:universal stress protein [Corynebacterium sp. P7003]|uniref:Universal stress protein n=1 Tax=Corynebacterium pygosceleis TaxID=2800406 RepID=A0ABT3WWF2_9CORY|nr:universal stress protein [Corynebacterium pygosceleis]MCX7445644.1 universal stress protein [Corynebacterium pygosceleis]
MPEPDPTTMLIAYDGSNEARRALNYAAELLSPRHVQIITAWEPMQRQAARAAGAPGVSVVDWSADDDAADPAHDEALAVCREGAEIAESLGLIAHAHLVESTGAIWSAIVDAAEQLRPDVIVTGTRGNTGFRSLLQSSTADNVLHHAGLPVFIVPPLEEETE